jgi:orotidine-5'-phosphate decarboxylase
LSDSHRNLPDRIADRLIVALDVEDTSAARRLVDALDGAASFYKVGMWLLYQPDANKLIDELIGSGRQVFLDCKMYDIGETVRRGVQSVARRGAAFVTVHGDPDIMQAAVSGAEGSALRILAVSVLTSLDDTGLRAMGYTMGVRELVGQRVRAAAASGCHGVIASSADDPDELRRIAGNESLLVVTPGIRMDDDPADDQRRTGTPADAIARGADYLVVGRPITRAAAPRDRALRIIDAMAAGQARR